MIAKCEKTLDAVQPNLGIDSNNMKWLPYQDVRHPTAPALPFDDTGTVTSLLRAIDVALTTVACKPDSTDRDFLSLADHPIFLAF